VAISSSISLYIYMLCRMAASVWQVISQGAQRCPTCVYVGSSEYHRAYRIFILLNMGFPFALATACTSSCDCSICRTKLYVFFIFFTKGIQWLTSFSSRGWGLDRTAKHGVGVVCYFAVRICCSYVVRMCRLLLIMQAVIGIVNCVLCRVCLFLSACSWLLQGLASVD
jgi:hypothetical protein